MILPSIDLMGGHAVQLVGGRDKKIDAGDPRPIARKFAVAGEVAIVDLDAALGTGSNRDVILDLMKIVPARVGGGIRSVDKALEWLDAGATRVVLGTAATPEVLRELPAERVVAALDAVDGEVVVDGWRTKTGRSITQRMKELRPYVGGFLVTFVEREGREGGTRLDLVTELVAAADGAEVTFAGGITEPSEIAEIAIAQARSQLGMALYSGRLALGDAIAAPLTSDRVDGLFPTIIVDEFGTLLGLAYSNRDTIREAVETRKGVYSSRKRGRWVKGETSGATQELLEVRLDCDFDTVVFRVRQHAPGFCHKAQFTCFGDARGIPALERTLRDRKANGAAGSYSKRLFEDPALLNAKLREEANELANATDVDNLIHEAADVLYFTLTKLVAGGASLELLAEELDRRARRVRRRGGDAK